MPDWIERKDVDLVTQSSAFSGGISADASAFGIPPETAADLADKQAAFAAAFELTQHASTNSSLAVIQKDDCRASLVQCMRMVAGIVRTRPGVTTSQMATLRMHVPNDRRGVVREPASAPTVLALSANGRVVRVKLSDPDHPTRKGKPRDVSSIAVFGFVGETPPAPLDQWKHFPNQTKTTFDIAFNGAEVESGAKVWITAAWLGTRQQPGPAAKPAYTYVSGRPVLRLKVLRAA